MVTPQGGNPGSASGTTLGLEGIREYRVVSNSFSAEYGMRVGSQVVIVSMSGDNSFHSSLLEYLRNSVLDARNFFDYTTPTTPGRLPPFKRNNFGASFGDPIKKDKTFFFATYEGLRERKGVTTVSPTVPPAAKVDGGLVPQISPVVKPFLTLFPDPNLPNNLYTFPFSQPNTEDYGQTRVDQNFSAADTAFVRYTIDNDTQVQALPYPQFNLTFSSRNQYSTLSEDHVFSPALLNTLRFSFSRTTFAKTSASGLLIGPQYSFVPGLPAGIINIGGSVTSWRPNNPAPNSPRQNILTWSDDMFYTRGRHALKFGGLINSYQQYFNNSLNTRGSLSFPSLTAFLLAQPSSYSAVTPGSITDRTYHFTSLGFYVQDDLRVLSNLTLNLGLRYEFNTTYVETHGHGSALRDVVHDATMTVGPPFQNPSLRNFGPRFGFAWDVAGDGKTAVRGGFGLLYDLGTLFDSINQTFSAPPFGGTSSVANPPTLTLPLVFPPAVAGNVTKGIDWSLQQPHMQQYNLTVERQLPWDMAATLTYAGSRGLNLMEVTEGNPTVPQILPDSRKFWTGADPRINPNWSTYELHTASGSSWYSSLQFSLIKRVTKGLQFQSAYTWSKSMDENVNQASNTSTTSNLFPADPSNIKLDKGLSNSDLAQNWHFNAIYRFPELARKGSVLGNLLNGWGMSGILSLQTGFPFTPMLQANRSRSGVNNGSPGSGTSAASDRPDLPVRIPFPSITQGVSRGCGNIPEGTPVGTPNLWFDPCAFTLQPAGFLGTAGRDILRGPGLANLDFSLTKDSPLRFLGESGKLEFRAEIFNILNRANFITPRNGTDGYTGGVVFAGTGTGPAVPLPTAAVLNATVSTSRQIQFALKILF